MTDGCGAVELLFIEASDHGHADLTARQEEFDRIGLHDASSL